MKVNKLDLPPQEDKFPWVQPANRGAIFLSLFIDTVIFSHKLAIQDICRCNLLKGILQGPVIE